MRLWKFPDQVIRLGILLIIGLAAMIVIRFKFVPESFGEVGHYRADAVPAIASRDIQYGGSQICVECHDAEGEAKRTSYHHGLSCEVCHGPSATHANDYEAQTPIIPRERGEACLYCHAYLSSRPTGFPQIIERLHNPLKPCIGCHDPHDPTPPEVPEACSACHAQISRTKAVSHHGSLDCETCHEVAAQHRENPRAFIPKKPTASEFCGRCHATDADAPPEIPRVELSTHGERYLCWQCHYPHFPES